MAKRRGGKAVCARQLPLFPCGTGGGDGSGAEFSACGRYRWRLWRVWDSERSPLVVIGLNPSTADAEKNDPTVTRCVRRAREGGYGGLVMLNLFGWRATKARAMLAALDPVGSGCDAAIRSEVAGRVCIAAWGTLGVHMGRCVEVLAMLRASAKWVGCLGECRDGQPRHPLYVAAAKGFEPYRRLPFGGAV